MAKTTSEKLKPPRGYQSWLNYAAATMDTRAASSEQVVHGTGDGDRAAMTVAVYGELIYLRQCQRVAEAHVIIEKKLRNCPIGTVDRSDLGRETDKLMALEGKP